MDEAGNYFLIKIDLIVVVIRVDIAVIRTE